jgi:hypothetical protein
MFNVSVSHFNFNFPIGTTYSTLPYPVILKNNLFEKRDDRKRTEH